MNTATRVTPWKLLAAGVTLTLATAFSWITIRQFTATVLAKHLERAPLLESVRLAPLNADTRTKLGYYYLNVEQNSVSAEQQFRKAIELQPTASDGWLGLAKTELTNANIPASLHALDKAIALDPKGTGTLWEAGNLYLVMGDTRKGLNQFRDTANSDGSLAVSRMETAWRATHDVDLVLDEGLPPTPEWRTEFMLYLVARQQPEAAIRAWDRLVELNQPVDRDKAILLVDYLIRTNHSNDAYHAWQGLLALSPKPSIGTTGAITNGGFESPILNGGFDWRSVSTNDVSVAPDSDERHAGAQSLAFQIKSARLASLPLMQFVKLEPNTRYRFRAFVKANLSTASGVHFAIAENGQPPLAQTEEITEQPSWKEVSAAFTTHADATIGTISLVRERGETLVRGNLWIDDVSLVKEQ